MLVAAAAAQSIGNVVAGMAQYRCLRGGSGLGQSGGYMVACSLTLPAEFGQSLEGTKERKDTKEDGEAISKSMKGGGCAICLEGVLCGWYKQFSMNRSLKRMWIKAADVILQATFLILDCYVFN